LIVHPCDSEVATAVPPVIVVKSAPKFVPPLPSATGAPQVVPFVDVRIERHGPGLARESAGQSST
jgi:hypothetical protein